MKNKGRRHKAGYDDSFQGIMNCKSFLVILTRPITSMSFRGKVKGKYLKNKWIKRMRGYLKSQTKEL